ncbi:hypothetical protein LJY25_12960 [Hymenobacter sp. BT175]|nr:hypothetical protein [Hymenobacter translucens]
MFLPSTRLMIRRQVLLAFLLLLLGPAATARQLTADSLAFRASRQPRVATGSRTSPPAPSHWLLGIPRTLVGAPVSKPLRPRPWYWQVRFSPLLKSGHTGLTLRYRW